MITQKLGTIALFVILLVENTQAQNLNQYLEKYYYCITSVDDCSGLGSLSVNPQLYNESAKDRLLVLLENSWSEQEKEEIAIRLLQIETSNRINEMERVLSDTSRYNFGKRRQKLLNHLDSLKILQTTQSDTLSSYTTALQKYIKRIEEYRVSDELIFIAGILGDQRYMSVLERALYDSIHYNQIIIKLALARNGLQPYYDQVLKLNRIRLPHRPLRDLRGNLYYDPLIDFSQRSSNLIYLASQESIKELGKWLNMTSDLYRYEVISHSDIYSSVGHNAVVVLRKVILNKNFQDHFIIDKVIYSSANVTSEDIKFTKKWIKDNFGNYEINKSYVLRDLTGELTYNY